MKFVQAKNYTRGRTRPPTMVVIHTAECGEHSKADDNVASYFAGSQAPGASAHYTVDDDSITQSVLEMDTAWHAGPVNGFSIGIEHAGYAKQSAAEWADPFSSAMLERSAQLAGDICKRYSIPVQKLTPVDLKAGNHRGLCGHIDVTGGLSGGKGHWDPGPNFPWQSYIERVAFHAGLEVIWSNPPPPILKPSEIADVSSFVEVDYDGATWLVCPVYVAPVAIGEAKKLAESLGCELPSPGLVDAIWKAATLKLDAAKLTRTHDGTLKMMDSWETHADQARRIADLVGSNELGKDYHLLAGAFKDVVVKDGKIGLYGWHRTNGVPIQPFYGGHALGWRDYSQGCRLVRRKV